MANQQGSRAPISFGSFEVDLQTQEVRKQGMRIRMPGQSFQILTMLLQAPGELVSRDLLQRALWPADTYVDFEHGVNAAVKRLREALGDSADNPTFIETLPRRGYRFIAPVTRPLDPDNSVVPLVPLEGAVEQATIASAPASKHLVAVVALAGCLALGGVWFAVGRREVQPPTVANTTRVTHDGKTKNSLNPFVSDGVHLYFTEGLPTTSGSGIAQVSAAGGEATLISTTLKNVLAVSPVSPDGSEMLVTIKLPDRLELWVQPLPAGPPHRIENIEALVANWMPDGARIVYGNDGAIMIADKDGSNRHELAKVPGDAFAIRYSPDHRRIRFDVYDALTQSSSIWEMDATGKNIHRLFDQAIIGPDLCCGNWSPDGNYYYFQAGRGDKQGIWVMPEGRSLFRKPAKRPSLLISGPLRFSSPMPSRDGKKLLAMGWEPRVELLRYDSQSHRFDPYLAGLSPGQVDYSSDKKWIAYVTYPEMFLWRSRADGSEKMQLTFVPGRAYAPRWSPDGSQIAFMDVAQDHPRRVGLISATGGKLEWITQNGADPTWAGDGNSVILGGPNGDTSASIYKWDVKTKTTSPIRGSKGLWSPRVSPGGRYIAALDSSATKLMLFDTNINEWSLLAEGQELGYNEWSRDGKYVYMREANGDAAEVVRVGVKGRVVEHLLSLKDFPQASDVFTWWMGFTADDALLLLRDRSVHEIYALDLSFH